MPCVGGSPWQNINRLRKGGKERVEAHIALFHSGAHLSVSRLGALNMVVKLQSSGPLAVPIGDILRC
eukprot:560211-Heterocapsa_arctica.AAC.2